MGWRVSVSGLDLRRKKMRVICIKLIYLNSPGLIEGVWRKMISVSQCDQVVTILSHFAISDVLREDIALPEEMGGFMTYKTPATSHSRSWSILPREVGWSGQKLLD